MTAAEKRLERLHLLRTMRDWGCPATAAAICERANAECSVGENHPDLEAIDELPHISPRGITSKLNAMSLAGLIGAEYMGVEPLLWSLTPAGLAAIEADDARVAARP